MEFGKAHVLDLVNDVRPIDAIHALAPSEAARQISLVLRPA
jgi:hypothetical protein